MIQIGGADGSSIKNAIIILDAEDQYEGWKWISKFVEDYKEKNGYAKDSYDCCFLHDENGFNKDYDIHYFYKEGETEPSEAIYIDRTILFHVATW